MISVDFNVKKPVTKDTDDVLRAKFIYISSAEKIELNFA
jgi:hypothetical protein